MTIRLVALSVLMVSSLAYADEPASAPSPAAPQVPAAEVEALPPRRWGVAIYGGANLKPKSTYALKSSSGTQLASLGTQNDTTSINIGLEATYLLPAVPALGLTFMLEYDAYIYSAPDVTPDFHVGYYVMPRVTLHLGDRVRAWAGLGAGLIYTVIGDTSGSADGVNIKIESPVLSIGLSPRVGIDLTQMLGIQASYFYSSVSADVTATQGTTSVKFTETVDRSWWAVSLRYNFY